jgi:hypothetical protein
MNKLTKVGCSALCGSLAAISAANAGDLSVTGGADVTYLSNSTTTTGNPFGMASAVTFKGTGELDNGWNFEFVIAEGDTVAFSAARVNITMGGLGTFEFDGGNSGNGIAAYDNVLPTAWEEAHGAGVSGGVKTVLGVGSSNNIQYSSPKFAGTEFAITYAHAVGKSDTADKAASGNTGTTSGRGYDATIKVNPSLGTEILSGLNLYAGGSVVEQEDNANVLEDKYEAVGAIVYALGPVEVGAMWSGLYTGGEYVSGTGYHTYKNHGFGVAFNVNDDFSVSYGEYQSRKAGYNQNATQGGPEDRVVEVNSWQAAYTMGGASFRVADVKVDNALWNKDADQSATIVSMGLAF